MSVNRIVKLALARVEKHRMQQRGTGHALGLTRSEQGELAAIKLCERLLLMKRLVNEQAPDCLIKNQQELIRKAEVLYLERKPEIMRRRSALLRKAAEAEIAEEKADQYIHRVVKKRKGESHEQSAAE